MNEQRAFTVTVTGCKYGCQFFRDVDLDSVARCIHGYVNQVELVRQNKDQLTNSCPMWSEAKPFIGEAT